ncbi:MAG: hypothetical protein AAFN93_25175 [Bacteroidota bacterium]
MKASILFISILAIVISCQKPSDDEEKTKQQIIETLENETRYFCERNLKKWQDQWSHESFTSKMYAGEAKFEELVGWDEINQFTVRHIKENPKPLAIPQVNIEFDIHLFDNTAFVFYAKEVDGHLVRETRFMVKENRQWKIARMQTIY